MNGTVEKVIEMPQIAEKRDYSKIIAVGYEFISLLFEILISFVPIILYWLAFYLSENAEVDYYEQVRNGSIAWIFLAVLVSGNFNILIDGKYKRGFAQRLIIACIIVFILILLGVYLILNFAENGMFNITLDRDNTICLVLLLGISTVILDILRILFFL